MVTAFDPSPGRVLVVLLFGACLLLFSRRADAQFGSLISPGKLAKAHANLEGMASCEKCHARGRQVAADRCLSCHKPVAERMAAKVGIHRDVKDDCVTCHVEHAGVDAELRPFDRTKFSHTTDTRFPLDGKHAPLAEKCESCHKVRSFLDVKTTCVGCHNDVHKGELGLKCEQCHSVKDDFKAAKQSFDHSKTDFPLTGAHQTEPCASCHKGTGFTGVKFASCANCHQSPHPSTMTGTCASCHGTASWATKKFDHASTKFPLVGKHGPVACASCHKGPPLKVKTDASTCATCHADPHKGEFKEDCDSCHSEKGFTSAKFDHGVKTKFPLTEGHAKVDCVKCHTTIALGVPTVKVKADFRGSSTACESCHADPHKGDLGTTCTTCHSATTFTVTSYTHEKSQDLLTGRHATVTCVGCHKPAALVTSTPRVAARVAMAGGTFTTTPTACQSCHEDVHLGQVGTDCAKCHSLFGEKFAADTFKHESSKFKLTGAHAPPLACHKCHKSMTTVFPAGTGTAVRLTGISTTCKTCHEDVHLGQVSTACETCHDTKAFPIQKYVHKVKNTEFFTGPHLTTDCVGCHKKVTGKFPAGRGTAVQFKVSTTCVTCHEDVHHGSMGSDCRSCHKVTRLKASHLPAAATRLAAVSLRHAEVSQ